MAGSAPRNVAIAAYRSTAEKAWNSASLLRNRFMQITGVMAETQRFPVVGTAEAEEHDPVAEFTPAGIRTSKPTAELRNRRAGDYIGRADKAMTNVDLMAAYGEQFTKAVGRQLDKDIINALNNVTTGALGTYVRPGFTVGTDNTIAVGGNLSADAVSEAVAILMDEDAWVGQEVTLVYRAKSYQNLAQDTDLASNDYVQGNYVTQTGRIPTIHGCTPVGIPHGSRPQGYGTLPTGVVYVAARDAVGVALGEEHIGEDEWIPERKAWLLSSEAICGAVQIQAAGVVKLTGVTIT